MHSLTIWRQMPLFFLALCLQPLPASAAPSQDDLNHVLLAAAANGYLDGTRSLIEQGADVNCRNKANETPLILAASKGKPDLIKLLLDHGADVNVSSDLTCVLSRAACSNSIDVVQLLLHFGADVNPPGDFRSPLSAAVESRRQDTASLLIQHHADVNSLRNGDATILWMAVHDRETEVIQNLLANGADVNAKGWPGETPLFEAIWNYDITTMKRLLDAGADVNVRDRAGRTPLIQAMAYRYNEPKEPYDGYPETPGDMNLLASDPDVYEKDHEEMVTLLLDHGADINATDKYGRTALTLADIGRKTEFTRFLKSKGAITKSPPAFYSNGEPGYSVTTCGKVIISPGWIRISRSPEFKRLTRGAAQEQSSEKPHAKQ